MNTACFHPSLTLSTVFCADVAREVVLFPLSDIVAMHTCAGALSFLRDGPRGLPSRCATLLPSKHYGAKTDGWR